MNPLDLRRSIINRVQVRAPDDSPALRLSIARLLDTANLRPAGLPPSAVLIVRHVADPLPGHMAGALRVDAAWERAIQARLAELYRRAVRPAAGVIPVTAEAVLFADEGELLACLILDMTHGEARLRWWWQSLLRTGALTPARLLCERARYVPAAMHHLASWHQLAAVLGALAAAQALDVLAAVGAAFALPNLAVWARALLSARSAQAPPDDEHDAGYNTASKPLLLTHWERILASAAVPRTAPRPAQMLAAAALALHREPTGARALLADHAAWQPVPIRPSPGAPRLMQPVPAAAPTHLAAAADADDAALAGPTEPTNIDIDIAVTTETEAQRAGAERLRHRRTENVTDSGPNPPRAHPAAWPEPAREAGVDAMQHISVAPAGDEATSRDPGPAVQLQTRLSLSDGILTELGGVLYLVNLALALDMPACFGHEFARHMGFWEVLEVIARALVDLLNTAGQADQACPADSYRSDPIWAALALLDGREPGELPGQALHRADAVRLPAGWLLDDAAPTMPSVRCRSLTAGLSEAVQAWLAQALPFIYARLHSALGIKFDAPPGTVTEVLLLRRAQVFITATHIDVVMRLEAISLPVRMSGLDRDPGWLAEIGRVIAFHFE